MREEPVDRKSARKKGVQLDSLVLAHQRRQIKQRQRTTRGEERGHGGGEGSMGSGRGNSDLCILVESF